jgi:putative ABC transport system permease protein
MIIGEWIRRLGYLLRRGAMEEELRREMESHRAQMEEPRSFGNTLRLREEARDAWGWRWLDDLMQDLRFAWRTLRRSPGFTLTAILTLAFGIGVNSAMFSVVNGLLLRPLYEHPSEVVGVSNRSTTPSGGARGLSYSNYLDLSEGTRDIFASVAASSMGFLGLDAGDGVKRTLAAGVTASYFQIFGAPLALGRVFTPEEARPGAGIRVAILSHSLWQQRGADPNMIGRSVRINGELFTVLGVAAEGFTGTSIPGPDVWLPLGTQGTFTTEGARAIDARDAHELGVVGRLRPDVSIDGVRPALSTVARRLEQAFPAENKGYTFVPSAPSRLVFMPGSGSVFTAVLSVALMLMPAIVLFVACINLADLLLARGHVRRQELAIRSSLGGGRWRLTRQLLTEGLLLAAIGGAAGLLLSTWATNALLASLRPVIPVSLTLPELGLDWRVLVGTLAFCLLASLIFGAWPAWALTGRAVVTDLKRHAGEEGRQPGGIRIGNALVIGQVALSLLLLATGGLFLMSALSASTADPGFRLDSGVLVEIDPSLAGYDEPRGRQAHLALVDRLRTVPGVEAVSIGSSFPFNSIDGDSRNVARAGAADARSKSVDAVFTSVGRDYARVLGLPMLAGRDFSDADLVPGSERVAIIDDALAQGLWPGESALGQQIQFLDDEGPQAKQPIRVVGIVPTVKHSLSIPRPFPHVYVPLGHRYESAMSLHVRVAGDRNERAMLGPIARAIRDLDDRVPVLRVETWRDHVYEGLAVWLFRAGARVFSAFGAIALLLAVIGVYGVKSYVVSRRTREFGIRIATGAHPRALLWQVMREGSRTTIVGIGIGLLLALGAGQVLQGILYGVDGFEPLVLVTAPLVLLAASLLASFVPALRATRVDPTVALRAE